MPLICAPIAEFCELQDIPRVAAEWLGAQMLAVACRRRSAPRGAAAIAKPKFDSTAKSPFFAIARNEETKQSRHKS
jgi:hypothetical protein